jgi:hypothetical protein
MYPLFAACSWACSPARPVVHSPQSLLMLLTLIASLVSLVSLVSPLASVVATGCECIPIVSTRSMSYEHKWKGNLCTVLFSWQIKTPKSVFGSHKASNTWIWILCPLWLHLETADP